MAHTINLATQASLGTYSTTAHYDPSMTNETIEPALHDDSQDEIRLVCAIAVNASEQEYYVLMALTFFQARSSAQ